MEDCRELAEQAKGRDKDAFAKLYELVYKDMYRFAFYTLKNQQDAEDVVSDTVADAFESIRRLRNVEAFRGWIFKILSNKCKRKLKEYVTKTVEMSDDLCVGQDFTEGVGIREVFAKLSDEERLIIAMQLFAGYSSREIGQILHKSDNTVRSSKSRALKKLEQLLKE